MGVCQIDRFTKYHKMSRGRGGTQLLWLWLWLWPLLGPSPSFCRCLWLWLWRGLCSGRGTRQKCMYQAIPYDM